MNIGNYHFTLSECIKMGAVFLFIYFAGIQLCIKSVPAGILFLALALIVSIIYFRKKKIVKSANKKSIGGMEKMMKRKRAYPKRPDGKMRWPDRKICIKECYF